MKKTFIVIGILLLIIVGIVVFNPQILFAFRATQKMALNLEGEQAATFYFPENKTSKDTLYMKGVIYGGTLDDIKEALDENPQVTTLRMVEVPGSVDDEVNLLASREIRKRNINTYIPEQGMVASGGTDMFLAGKERAAHATAKLGVHSWAGMDKEALDYPKDHEEHKKYLKYYEEMNIPSEFYWYTLEAAPASNIHWMTPEEITKYKVVTQTTKPNELLTIQQTLASDAFEGRGTGKNQKAQDFIRNYFKEIGLQSFNNSFDIPFTFKERKTGKERKAVNLVGYVKGKTYPDTYLVVGAHYDHLGVVDGVVYNGADDNASGTAAIIMLAKYFKKNTPEHSIIFAAFDAEELGLHGSINFVKIPPVPLDQIKFNVNMDMISRNPKNEIYISGTHQFPQFKPLLQKVAAKNSLKISFGHDDPSDTTKDYWMDSSDNSAFLHAGIPNISFGEEDHPGYHHHTDDFERIHPTFFKKTFLLIQSSIEVIDKNFPNPVKK